jgi:hypothetical protein
MATTLYLRSALADVSRGSNTANLSGTAVAWRARELSVVEGTGAGVTATVATVTGPTSGIETGSPVNEWISPPLAAAVTISSSLQYLFWASESNAMANAGIGARLERLDSELNVVSVIWQADSGGVELGTAISAYASGTLPTTTSLNKGDRLRLRVYFEDANGTMASGYTCTLRYDGAAANSADSRIILQPADDLTFMSGPDTLINTDVQASVAAAAYGDNRWIATSGISASYRTTTDLAATWTAVTPASNTATLYAVGYGYESNQTSRWLVGGGSGSAVLYESTNNGTTWSAITSGLPSVNIGNIAYGNDTWIVFGSTQMSVSTNPTNGFTAVSPNFSQQVRGVAYGNGVWVAVGDSRSAWTATNPFGPWTSRTIPFTSTSSTIYGVHYADGVWVAVNAGGEVCTATDPTSTWTLNANTPVQANDQLRCIVYHAPSARWYAGGTDLTNGLVLYASNPAQAWQPFVNPVATVTAIVSDNEQRLLVVNNNTSDYLNIGQLLYMTNTASNIVDQGASVTELTAWTSRGNG